MVSSMFNTVSGKKIGILGFAFKKDTGDTRETPAIDVCNLLLAEKAKLAIHDPKVSREQVYSDLGKDTMEKVDIDDDPYITCAGAHAIAILTEWDSFKSLDYQRSTTRCRSRRSSSTAKHPRHGEAQDRLQCWAVGKSLNNIGFGTLRRRGRGDRLTNPLSPPPMDRV